MKKLIYVFSVIAFLPATSCYTGIPLRTDPASNNSTYDVEYLFEHEGCKVYRFLDHGNYVYFTNCAGTITSIANDSTKTRVVNQVQILNQGK